MDTHLVSAIVFYMLWFQPSFTVNSQTSDTCVFGTDASCFYQCKCQFFNCNPQDPNCKICYDLTGICIQEERACKIDTMVDDIYVTRYWTGAACQKGNIGAMKLYSVSGSFLNIDPAVGGATDGTLDWYVAFYVTPSLHTATIYLEETYKIEFIDIFLQSEDINLSQLANYIQAKLVMKNGSFSECVYEEYPSYDYRLRITLVNKERMHFLCHAPSVGYKLEVSMQGTGFNLYEVHVFEIIIIGHRYAEVNLQNCLQLEGDEDIIWCSQCNNSLPPECQQECLQGLTGINCNDTVEAITTTTETYSKLSSWKTFSFTEESTVELTTKETTTTLVAMPSEKQTSTAPTDSEPSGVVFVAVGIIVGLLLCLCGILVVVIFYKHKKKNIAGNLEITKDTEQTYDEEETYDVLDDVSVNTSNGNNMEKVVPPIVAFRPSGVANEYSDITGLGNNRKSITDTYLSAGSTEGLKDEKSVTDVYIDRKGTEGTEKTSQLRDSYLSPRDLDNPTYIHCNIETSKADKQCTTSLDSKTDNPRKALADEYLSVKSTEALKDAKTVTDVKSEREGRKTTEKSDPLSDGYLSPRDLDSSTYISPDIQTNKADELKQCTEALDEQKTKDACTTNTGAEDTEKPNIKLDVSQQVPFSNHGVIQETDSNPYMIPRTGRYCKNFEENDCKEEQEKLEDTYTCTCGVNDTDDPYLRPVLKNSKIAGMAVFKSNVSEISENPFATGEDIRVATPKTTDTKTDGEDGSSSEAEVDYTANIREIDQETSELQVPEATCEHSNRVISTPENHQVEAPNDKVRPMSVSW